MIVRRAIQEAIESVLNEPGFTSRPGLGKEMITARVLDALERPALRNAVEVLGMPATAGAA